MKLSFVFSIFVLSVLIPSIRSERQTSDHFIDEQNHSMIEEMICSSDDPILYWHFVSLQKIGHDFDRDLVDDSNPDEGRSVTRTLAIHS